MTKYWIEVETPPCDKIFCFQAFVKRYKSHLLSNEENIAKYQLFYQRYQRWFKMGIWDDLKDDFD